MTENFPEWRGKDGVVNIDYITEQLKNSSTLELPYNFGPREVTAAEHASRYLQEKGFGVREREENGEDRRITLIVSRLEKGVKNA